METHSLKRRLPMIGLSQKDLAPVNNWAIQNGLSRLDPHIPPILILAWFARFASRRHLSRAFPPIQLADPMGKIGKLAVLLHRASGI